MKSSSTKKRIHPIVGCFYRCFLQLKYQNFALTLMFILILGIFLTIYLYSMETFWRHIPGNEYLFLKYAPEKVILFFFK